MCGTGYLSGMVVATGSPTAVLFGHEMGGLPRSLGASGCTVPWQGAEFGLGYCQAVWDKAAGYRRAGSCPDVVCYVAPRDGSQLVWSAPEITPGGCLWA